MRRCPALLSDYSARLETYFRSIKKQKKARIHAGFCAFLIFIY